MKKVIKILIILMLASVIMLNSQIFAANDVINFDSHTSGNNAIDPNSPGGTTSLMGKVGRVVGLLQWVTMIGGIIVIAVIGVKYMMASLEEKADYKKSVVPLILGIVVVMSATAIANLLFNIV